MIEIFKKLHNEFLQQTEKTLAYRERTLDHDDVYNIDM